MKGLIMNKPRKVAKFLWDHAEAIIAVTTLTYVAYRLTGHRLVPIEGHFIPKSAFQRLLSTDDTLILLTPLGEFKVVPN
jgi:hypothetical protein